MKASRFLCSGLLGCLLGAGSCVEPYRPELAPTTANLLVVDGYINGRGVTTVTLSRSLLPTDARTPAPETRALVSIRSEQGVSYPLSEGPAGTYSSAALTLSPGQRYQLRLSTRDGHTYESALTVLKASPPIDRVRYRYEEPLEGVRILADAHDDTGSSTYYRWQFENTWQFTSQYRSTLQYNATTKLVELRPDDIYHCWRTENSNNILQASTVGLGQDAVLNYPVALLATGSEQLRIKYSIEVQLLTETREEYDYWELLRKNSQGVGSLNDPLPSQVTGNVRCVSHPEEVALGFVGAHTPTRRRIFINRGDIPSVFLVRPDTSAYAGCQLVLEERCKGGRGVPIPVCLPSRVTQVFNRPQYYMLTDSGDPSNIGWEDSPAYYGGTPECVDCRLRGTNVKPSFWP